MRELAGGIDTLILSYYGSVDDRFAESLDNAKEATRRFEKTRTLSLGGEIFTVSPSSLNRMAYRLDHQYGVIGVSPKASLPVVRWQPRAEFLHASGPAGVAEWLRGVTCQEFTLEREVVSRVDLHADFQGIGFDRYAVEDFVTRSTHQTIEREHSVFTGFRFGKRKSGTLTARIYDKSAEIEAKGGEYWYSMWGEEWIPDEVVWRVEFEFARGILRDLGVEDLDSLYERVPGMWAYATRDWLSLRVPTTDETRSRWPLDPRWAKVQASLLGTQTMPLARIREIQRHRSLEEEIPHFAAAAVRLGALLGDGDPASVLRRGLEWARQYWDGRGDVFTHLALVKAIEMGLV